MWVEVFFWVREKVHFYAEKAMYINMQQIRLFSNERTQFRSSFFQVEIVMNKTKIIFNLTLHNEFCQSKCIL